MLCASVQSLYAAMSRLCASVCVYTVGPTCAHTHVEYDQRAERTRAEAFVLFADNKFALVHATL